MTSVVELCHHNILDDGVQTGVTAMLDIALIPVETDFEFHLLHNALMGFWGTLMLSPSPDQINFVNLNWSLLVALWGCVYACMRGCVYACMRGCVYAGMCVCVHAGMCVCVHAGMCVCVHAGMCVCVVIVSV
jgi:hypothetical protein